MEITYEHFDNVLNIIKFVIKEPLVKLSDQIWLDLFSKYISVEKWTDIINKENLTGKWNEFQSKKHQSNNWDDATRNVFLEYVNNLNPEKILTIKISKQPDKLM